MRAEQPPGRGIPPRDPHAERLACPEHEGMCFVQRLHPEASYLNQAATLRIEGGLDLSALRRAWQDVVACHEPLRTHFEAAEGGLIMHVQDDLQAPLPLVDLSHEGGLGALDGLARALCDRPFDPARGPLMRARLARLGADHHAFIYVAHHAITDRWSLGVVMRTLMARYAEHVAGRSAGPTMPAVSYSDYVAWRRPQIKPALDAALNQWRERLADGPPEAELPVSSTAGGLGGFRAGRAVAVLSSEEQEELRGFARGRRMTPSMVLLAAWALLLERLTQRGTITVGLPVANRARVELEGLAGLFMGTVAAHVDLREDLTVTDVLARTKRAALDAYRQSQVPFPLLVERMRAEGLLDERPLFDTLFNAVTVPLGVEAPEGLQVELQRVAPAQIEYPFVIETEVVGDTLELHLDYQRDRIAPDIAQAHLGHYVTLLRGMMRSPQASARSLEILSSAERADLLEERNDTATPYPSTQRVHELFAEQANRWPERVALRSGDRSLTYRELAAAANRLAHALRAAGVERGSFVGLGVPRSIEFVIGALATLQAGGAYLPLDPEDPPSRLALQLDDARPAVVLTAGESGNLAEIAPDVPRLDIGDPVLSNAAETPVDPVDVVGDAEDLAYVIYTSGSTGTPKGTLIPHRGVTRLIHGLPMLPLDEGLTTLFVAAPTFDASTFELWAALLHGGTCVVYAEPRVELDRLEEVIREAGVDGLWLTSTLFNTVVDLRPDILRDVRFVITGGEALSMPHVRRALERLPKTQLFNGYGPTESTTFATMARLQVEGLQGLGAVPIGGPIGNTRVHVLDPQRRLLPVGSLGEIHIGGDGLARGYLNDPERTAERFVPDPFCDEPGARLYRTGDLGRWLPSGGLEFVGRADEQLKIRGFRIEPKEVEAALSRHPDVLQCAVVARGEGRDRDLVAYVTSAREAAALPQELRTFVGEALPKYMVPAHVVVLDVLPRTRNGKLDRARLPAPSVVDRVDDGELPATPTERRLAGLWSELLDWPSPRRQDNFFACGGHSLRALALIARITEAWKRVLPVRAVFEHPTLAALAARIDEALAGEASAAPALVRAPPDLPIPLSYSQERIWFLERMEPDSPLYTIPRAMRVVGPLMQDRLRGALDAIVHRHEVLRTAFVPTGSGERQSAHEPSPVEVASVDLRSLGERERWGEADRLLVAEARRPFDLRGDQLLRAQIIRMGEDDRMLQVVFHHGFADGWSLGIFWRELSALYADPQAKLPELALQYGDYAAWQRGWLAGPAIAEQLDTWRRRFTPLPAPLELPMDRPRREVMDIAGARRYALLPRALVERLERLAKAQGATLFMALLAGLWALLYRVSGQGDVVVGAPVAGRASRETEDLIGFFVNNLALRGEVDGRVDFQALVAHARERTLEAYENQDVPFEKVVETLRPDRSLAHTPLYQVMLVLLNTPDWTPELSGLRLTPHRVDKGTSVQDLTIFLEPAPDGLRIEAEYRTSIFDGSTIDRLLERYERLLTAAIAAPRTAVAQLPLLDRAERERIEAWGRNPSCYPAVTVLDLIQQQLEADPAAEAVRDGTQSVSRAELAARVDALTAHLIRLGVRPGDVVGICLERGIPAIVSMLATLRAGGAYLPLEPGLPEERWAWILEDAAPSALIVAAGAPSAGPAGGVEQLAVDPDGRAVGGDVALDGSPPTIGPEDLATLIYTSGSTGRPKGVLGTHRALANRVQWGAEAHPPRPGERWAHKTALAFVDAVFEVFGALALGVRLEIVSTETASDPRRLLPYLVQAGVSRLVVVPSLLEALLDEVEATGAPDDLWHWTSSGERLRPELVRRFARLLPGRTLVNIYGSTEVGADATAWTVDLQCVEGPVPIGRPLANVCVEVLDDHGQLAPIGVAGELFVGGAGLARGYHRRPELDAEYFVDAPTRPGERRFRTGDRACWRPDGTLAYLGRRDRQVKLRGVRIELEEVEAALRSCPGVRDAAAVVQGEGRQQRLVGYVSPATAVEGLVVALGRKLPALLRPSQLIGLPELPRTPSGKLDSRALIASAPAARESGDAEPSDDLERRLLVLWREALGVEVGVNQDFFAAGGHSLLAVRLFARIERELGVELELPMIFHAPTVAQLARYLRGAHERRRPRSQLVPIQPEGAEPPLFLVHPAPGTVLCYGDLARRLGASQPVFGLEARGLGGVRVPLERVGDMAAHYLQEIAAVRGPAPLRLGGWSVGGVIAYEMAQQLVARGEAVEFVLLVDTHCPASSQIDRLAKGSRRVLRKLRGRPDANAWIDDLDPERRPVAQANLRALRHYVAEPYEGRVVLLQAEAGTDEANEQLAAWRLLAPQIEVIEVPGTHGTVLGPEHAGETAARLEGWLAGLA